MATNNSLNNSSTGGFSSTGGAFTANGGAVSIGTDNAANAISIGVGSTARTIGIGNSAAAHVITIGTTNGAASLTENVGTGNYVLDGVTSSTYTIGASTTTGTITIGGTAQTGAITFGGGTGAQTVNLGTGATGVKTIHIGDSAVANVITIGSTTGAASLTLQSGSGSIISNTGFTVNSTGLALNTKQPAFQAYQSTSPSNVTGDATVYKLAINTEIFDQTNNYDNSTFTFTAPVTGKYFFNAALIFSNVIAQTTMQIQIITTGNTFNGSYIGGANSVAAGAFLGGNTSCFCTMTAADTATFNAIASGSTKTVGITGGQTFTYAGGYLVC